MRWWLVSAALLLASRGCAFSQAAPAKPPATSTASGVQPKFVDITAASGVHFQSQASHTTKKYLLETMGSGVALFDYDNDGRLDLFLVNGAPLNDPTAPGTIPKKTGPKYWNRLYHQRKDGTFEDVTEKAGLAGTNYDMGVAVGDYDNDGYEDLYVTVWRKSSLSQQWRWNVHRCHREVWNRWERLVYFGRVGRSGQ